MAHPRQGFYCSVDNDRHLLWASQDKVGLCPLILSDMEGAFAIIRAIRHSRPVNTASLVLLKPVILGRNVWNATSVMWLRELFS